MTIDTSVASKVAKQCLYLAGPGVLVNGSLTATFLYYYLPYDWSFLMCLLVGAILCATDPVAVVALLKELGACTTLTVQIQGESLLNDGTAIVFFQIISGMMQGHHYDGSDVIIYLVRTAMFASLLGFVIGQLTFTWISAAHNKLEHNSGVIQIALTICCAYFSFILSEMVLKMSGVLATVTSSMVLAHKMWPVLVDRQSMTTVWHMLEYMLNTLVFFLAGALTGATMIDMNPMDMVHLIAIYVACTLIRGLTLFVSRPILTMLSPVSPVSPAEALVMTWAGLRGAVGLTLAIQVSVTQVGGVLSKEEANRVLFYVGGIALMTTVVNATTCPMLVKFLELAQLPETKAKMLLQLHKQLERTVKFQDHSEETGQSIRKMLAGIEESIMNHHKSIASDHFRAITSPGHWARDAEHRRTDDEANEQDHSDSSANDHSNASGVGPVSIQVQPSAKSDNNRVPKHIQIVPTSTSQASSLNIERAESQGRMQPCASEDSIEDPHHAMAGTQSSPHHLSAASLSAPVGSIFSVQGIQRALSHVVDSSKYLQPASEIGAHLLQAKAAYDKITVGERILIADSTLPFEEGHNQADLLKAIHNSDSTINSKMMCAMVEVFLNLVHSHYWTAVEEEKMIKGTDQAETLFASVKFAQGQGSHNVLDLKFIEPNIGVGGDQAMLEEINAMSGEQSPPTSEGDSDLTSNLQLKGVTNLHTFVESMAFSTSIMVVIVSNAVLIFVEDEFATKANTSPSPVWTYLDIVYNSLFFIEFALKFLDQKCGYFQKAWNLFDFGLVLTGWVSIAFTMHTSSLSNVAKGDVSREGRLFRIARVFRMMRILRLLRLVRFWKLIKAKMLREDLSLAVAEHMQKIAVLGSFVSAHVQSQIELVKYLGNGEGKQVSPEMARCLLQSQVSVYNAICQGAIRERCLDRTIVKMVGGARTSKSVMDSLFKFVMRVHNKGVISAHEAESILHTMREHMNLSQQKIRRAHFGYVLTVNGSDEQKGSVRLSAHKGVMGQSKKSPKSSKETGNQATPSTVGQPSDAPTMDSVVPMVAWNQAGPDRGQGEPSTRQLSKNQQSSSSNAAVPGSIVEECLD
jgi:NhaP-type Na+/H+ or K+/H+ antiporter